MASVRYLDRKLVRNILRHTETHNRLQEESCMWRDRAKEAFDRGNEAPFRRRGRDRDKWQTGRTSRMNQEDRWDYNPLDRTNWNDSQLRNRDIFRSEQGNQERWGHTGFMELYPEEFINKESMDEMSNGDSDADRKKKKKKKRTTKETHHKRKHDAVKKKRKERTSHKRRKHQESSSSSSSEDSNSDSDSSSSSSSSESEEGAPLGNRDRRRRAERAGAGRERPTKRRPDCRDRSPPSVSSRFRDDSKYQERQTKKEPEKKNQDEEEEYRRKDKSPRRTHHRGDGDSRRGIRDGERGRHMSGTQSREDRALPGTRDGARSHGHRTEDRAGSRDKRDSRSERRPSSPGQRSRHRDESEGPSEATRQRSRADGGSRDKSDRHRHRSSPSTSRKDRRDKDQGSGKDRHGRKR